jgi:hypothetical protein
MAGWSPVPTSRTHVQTKELFSVAISGTQLQDFPYIPRISAETRSQEAGCTLPTTFF